MRLALLLALALSAAAATAAPAGAPVVTCGSIIVPGGTFSWKPERVVLGVVDVPPAYIPQTVPSGDARWPYWSKAGMVVRADSPLVAVSVPPASRKRVAIGWGNVDGGSALRFETCPDSSSLGGWNPYAGGFLLKTRSACVPLVFRVGGRTESVRFGIGKRCGR
jgi:hypothetical protein